MQQGIFLCGEWLFSRRFRVELGKGPRSVRPTTSVKIPEPAHAKAALHQRGTGIKW